MKLDMVHDIQSVYRKVLNAMARPGIIENLEEAQKVDINISCFRGTFLIMLLLLDREVSFNVISEESNKVATFISQITYAKEKKVEEADYVFILQDACDKCLDEAIENVKIGNLIDPNKSATIIAEFENLKGSGFSDKKIELTGPGIKDITILSSMGKSDWIEKRRQKNEEYPLGIDLIYVDKSDSVLCIPRSTIIKESED